MKLFLVSVVVLLVVNSVSGQTSPKLRPTTSSGLSVSQEPSLRQQLSARLEIFSTDYQNNDPAAAASMFTALGMYLTPDGKAVKGREAIAGQLKTEMESKGSLNPAVLVAGYIHSDDTAQWAFSVVNITSYREKPTFKYDTGTWMAVWYKPTSAPSLEWELTVAVRNSALPPSASAPAADVSMALAGSGDAPGSIADDLKQFNQMFADEFSNLNATSMLNLFTRSFIVAPAYFYPILTTDHLLVDGIKSVMDGGASQFTLDQVLAGVADTDSVAYQVVNMQTKDPNGSVLFEGKGLMVLTKNAFDGWQIAFWVSNTNSKP